MKPLPLEYHTNIKRRVIYVALFTLIGLAVRLIVLYGALIPVSQGREFADDFVYYRQFLVHPLILVTGDGATSDISIYAPLIPIQVAYPGKWLCSMFGEFAGLRLAMIFYDVIALAITAWCMLASFGNPLDKKRWLALLGMTVVPGAIGATAVFAQEDTIAGFWTAIALLLVRNRRPTLAATIGAMGLFTHKLFGLLLSVGMWIGIKELRTRLILTTGAVCALFGLFTIVRWKYSGLLLTSYAYNAIFNSPSPWAAINRWIHPITFEESRLLITVCTMLITTAAIWVMCRKRIGLEEAVVGIHAVFFTIFIGIQPEHHQWFMPFLMIFAWKAVQQNDWFTFFIAWTYSGWAYAFKIAYGLQERASASAGGKEAFRNLLGSHSQEMLILLQNSFHIIVIICGLLLFWRTLILKHKDLDYSEIEKTR